VDFTTALLLLQDGLVTGAIYALLALALVLVFTTTRLLLISQGEFVTFSALTFANLQTGATPKIVWLIGVLALAGAVLDLFDATKERRVSSACKGIAARLVVNAALIALAVWLGRRPMPALAGAAVAVVLVTALGPLLYRVAFQPMASATIRSLFVVAIALHFVLEGLGLAMFGGEGFRADPMLDFAFPLGPVTVTGQTLLVAAVVIILFVGVRIFFGTTLPGKALRAAAVNRVGAQLVGIRSRMTGQLAFTLAAFIGAQSGVLMAGLTTVYYDSGLLIGLKAVLGAVCGAMVSYPGAIIGALGVGVLESFAAFFSSSLSEALVFGALIPVLLWLSLPVSAREEGEEL
jgi:branched-chain amino acid transport system permease protein